ncbi:hypothetical protein KAI87_13450 [Myxococcota bacterium]|nr:hypothetical protein [Myxococcota bacterium]
MNSEMSTPFIGNIGWDATSAGSPMSATPETPDTRPIGAVRYTIGTTVRSHNIAELSSVYSTVVQTVVQTGGGQELARQSAESAIMELRRLTSLTWEQLANLFGTTRRSLHFWASGKTMNKKNEEHLYRALAVINRVDRGSGSKNRMMLFQDYDGVIPFDLLKAQKYSEFSLLVGPGSGRHHEKLSPLSDEAQKAHKPLPPEMLVDAMTDPIHRDIGRGRAARTPKKRQHEGE